MRQHELEPLPQEKSPSMKMKDRRGRNNLLCLQTCLALVCLEIVRSLCLNNINISCDLLQLAVMLQSERQICCIAVVHKSTDDAADISMCHDGGQALKESFYLMSI